MNYLILSAIFGLLMGMLGYSLARLIETKFPNGQTDATSETLVVAEQKEIAVESEDFTVAGKPRKPTWKQRRRELEAAARTKRRKIEEWRD